MKREYLKGAISARRRPRRKVSGEKGSRRGKIKKEQDQGGDRSTERGINKEGDRKGGSLEGDRHKDES